MALPKVTSPGKLDKADLAALDKYIARLKRATKNAPPVGGKARDVYDQRMAKLATYTTRKSKYRVRLGDTAAKRAATTASKKK